MACPHTMSFWWPLSDARQSAAGLALSAASTTLWRYLTAIWTWTLAGSAGLRYAPAEQIV